MSTLKNPFGMRDGRVIVIDDLDESERGLNCNCSCPMCGESFEARMGEERIHHFSHTKKSSCDAEEGVLTGLYLLLAEQLAHSTIEIPAAYIHADYKQFKYTTIHGIDTITENDFDRIFPRNTIHTFPRNLPNPEETMIVYRASSKAWDGVNGKTAFGEPYYECLIDPCFFANNKWEIRQDLEQSIGAIKAISNFNRSMILRIRLYRWCRFEKKYRDDSVQLPEGIPTLYIDIDEAVLNPSPEETKNTTATVLEHLLNPANMQWESKSLPAVQVEKGKQALMKNFLLRRAREIIDEQKKDFSILKNRLTQAESEKQSLQMENAQLKEQLEDTNTRRIAPPERITYSQEQLQPYRTYSSSARYENPYMHAYKDHEGQTTPSTDADTSLKKLYPTVEDIPKDDLVVLGNTRYIYCLTCQTWRLEKEMKDYRCNTGTICEYCQKRY